MNVAGYTVEAPIARGRFATVHHARELRTGLRVALKLARCADLRRAGRSADFAHEASVMAALPSGAAPALLGAGTTPDDAWLAMAPCDGDWRAVARPVNAADAARELLAVAQALAAFHAQGWVHRDIKPANVLLQGGGTRVLADFGEACRQGESARPGTCVGTPRYAAPEQTQGAPAAPSADVYAFGAMAWEWLAGRPLFTGETSMELQAQHLLAPVPALPDPFAALQPIADAMLAKDAALRPRDGAAAVARLARMLATTPRHPS